LAAASLLLVVNCGCLCLLVAGFELTELATGTHPWPESCLSLPDFLSKICCINQVQPPLPIGHRTFI
jgi:hypothetical protein